MRGSIPRGRGGWRGGGSALAGLLRAINKRCCQHPPLDPRLHHPPPRSFSLPCTFFRILTPCLLYPSIPFASLSIFFVALEKGFASRPASWSIPFLSVDHLWFPVLLFPFPPSLGRISLSFCRHTGLLAEFSFSGAPGFCSRSWSSSVANLSLSLSYSRFPFGLLAFVMDVSFVLNTLHFGACLMFLVLQSIRSIGFLLFACFLQLSATSVYTLPSLN